MTGTAYHSVLNGFVISHKYSNPINPMYPVISLESSAEYTKYKNLPGFYVFKILDDNVVIPNSRGLDDLLHHYISIRRIDYDSDKAVIQAVYNNLKPTLTEHNLIPLLDRFLAEDEYYIMLVFLLSILPFSPSRRLIRSDKQTLSIHRTLSLYIYVNGHNRNEEQDGDLVRYLSSVTELPSDVLRIQHDADYQLKPDLYLQMSDKFYLGYDPVDFVHEMLHETEYVPTRHAFMNYLYQCYLHYWNMCLEITSIPKDDSMSLFSESIDKLGEGFSNGVGDYYKHDTDERAQYENESEYSSEMTIKE